MNEPTYSFTVPSIHDDTSLDCRIYHPKDVFSILQSSEARLRGAIVAHPYAPLGGCYDDETVLSVTECLLKQGYVVLTFNFRGAGGSAGKTSWTGKPEVDDYSTVIGLAVYYLQNLKRDVETDNGSKLPIDLLLAGYSFGSLILARLPSVPIILQRFESAEKGTAASEIFLRARTLAKQTRQASQESRATKDRDEDRTDGASRTRSLRSALVNIGGEESSSSERRRSRDSRRSAEIISEVPHQIKSHIKRHSRHQHNLDDTNIEAGDHPIAVQYLLISPVLVPLTTSLLSPGIPFTSGTATDQQDAGTLSLKWPTLITFGSSDTFTSSKKLRMWSEKLAEQSLGRLEWTEISGAGHFWREKGVMRALQEDIISWLNKP
ncbi:uncharacterized protein MYCFIDRAFT_201151 [Pseudocercospora fijiensis CIRAD86]|uniref:Xaa-Pro dipeptidyl-peptidase-like domain-containing protein n=1 Tax=Pseudocercospora fijiensis (strain CIRAD86) TaxID=383855 RepID=N1Q9E3_PSEFD|nr:uncharacterized protein MYCFIDRAFT_201151 [Pseudocercospora fijiensis CIRAD86]EME87508.1 hypothetical protein MYCFIDRAFT_201151 [Pseudocercospora fijiensis CIRAD86]